MTLSVLSCDVNVLPLQVKDLKGFLQQLKIEVKEEEKLVNVSVMEQPKQERKQTLRRKLSDIQGFKVEKEQSYKNQLAEDLEKHKTTLAQKQKDEMRNLEIKFLLSKHGLIRRKCAGVGGRIATYLLSSCDCRKRK